MDLKAMKTAELVELYNSMAAKPVKKFENRAVAERRVADLLAAKEVESAGVAAHLAAKVITTPAVTIPPGTEKLLVRSRRQGIEDSWKDPVVAAKRSERYQVMADGQKYRSVMSAFLNLKLDKKDVIRLRMALVEMRRPIEHEGHVFELV